MKVLVVSTLYPPRIIGGAEKAAAALCSAFARRGTDVVVVTLHEGSKQVVEEQEGVRIYRVPLDNSYWPFRHSEKPSAVARVGWHIREMWNAKAVRRLEGIIALEKPDVVHTHNFCGFSIAIWSMVKQRGVPLVHTMHDYYLLCSRSTLYRDGANCKTLCSDCRVLTSTRRRLLELPDSVVSVSHFTLRKHNQFTEIDATKGQVICNIQGHQDEVLPISTDPTKLTFGFIGKIEQEKGIETLLEATGRLPPGWLLKIAGKGNPAYVDALRAKYPDPRIEWLGFAVAATFYSIVDTVIVPSQWGEPLTYICLESLHAGKPMICAESGGIPEMAALANVVEMFQPGNAQQLAGIMSTAIGAMHLWKTVQIPGPEVLSQFTEQSVHDRYMDVYLKSISRNRSTKANRV